MNMNSPNRKYEYRILDEVGGPWAYRVGTQFVAPGDTEALELAREILREASCGLYCSDGYEAGDLITIQICDCDGRHVGYATRRLDAGDLR